MITAWRMMTQNAQEQTKKWRRRSVSQSSLHISWRLMYQVLREKPWYLPTWFSVSFPVLFFASYNYFYKTKARKSCKVGDYSLSYLDFVNIPSSYNLEYFHKLVVENGGSFSMNLNDSVTHCIAAEKKGIYLCSRSSFSFHNGILNTDSLKYICMLTFRYQISGSFTAGKDHSLWVDIRLL